MVEASASSPMPSANGKSAARAEELVTLAGELVPCTQKEPNRAPLGICLNKLAVLKNGTARSPHVRWRKTIGAESPILLGIRSHTDVVEGCVVRVNGIAPGRAFRNCLRGNEPLAIPVC